MQTHFGLTPEELERVKQTSKFSPQEMEKLKQGVTFNSEFEKELFGSNLTALQDLTLAERNGENLMTPKNVLKGMQVMASTLKIIQHLGSCYEHSDNQNEKWRQSNPKIGIYMQRLRDKHTIPVALLDELEKKAKSLVELSDDAEEIKICIELFLETLYTTLSSNESMEKKIAVLTKQVSKKVVDPQCLDTIEGINAAKLFCDTCKNLTEHVLEKLKSQLKSSDHSIVETTEQQLKI